MRRKRILMAAVASLAVMATAAPLAGQSEERTGDPFVQIIPHAEEGFLFIPYHTFQSGTGTTDFNFVSQGGQENLFAFQRFSVEIVLGGNHRVTALYQPLTILTKTVADRNATNGGADVVIGDAVFAPGTPMDLQYGFDFWRVSYLYDFWDGPDTILGAGISLQIRNASIVFSSSDGSARFVSQNVGPVPIIKVRAAHWFTPLFGLDFEADGFYASSAFFNGAARPFTGWVWDAAVSAQTRFLEGSIAFLTVRSIGGGAEGSNAYDSVFATSSGAGAYTKNVLATVAVCLGVSIEP
jgi:hypothetical protein